MPRPEGIRRGVILLGAGEATTRVLGFALSAVVARVAGLDALAALTVAQGVVAYATLAGDAGLSTDAVRRLARGEESRSRLVALTLLAQTSLTVVATFALLAVVALLPLAEQSKQAVLALSLLPLSYACNVGYVLQADARFAALVVGRVGGQIVGVATGLVFLLLYDSFLLAVASLVLGAAVTDLLLALSTKRDWWPFPAVTIRAVLRRLAQGRGFFGYALANHAAASSPLLVIALVGSMAEVAEYSVAHRILFLVLAPAQVLATALLPTFSRAGHSLDEQYWSLVTTVILFAAAGGAFCWAFAEPVSVLMFGPSAATAGLVVRLVGAFVPVAYFSLLLKTTLLSRGQAGTQAIVTCLSLLPLVAGGTFLAVWVGATGVVYALIASEAFVVVAVSRALGLHLRRPIVLMLGAVLLFLSMVGVAQLARTAIGSVAIEALVFVAAALPCLAIASKVAGGRRLTSLFAPRLSK